MSSEADHVEENNVPEPDREEEREKRAKFSDATNEDMWRGFAEFQDTCAERAHKIRQLQDSISEKQFSHEKEFRDYQASVGETIANLHSTIESAREDLVNKVAEVKTLREKLASKTEYASQLEQENYALKMTLKEQQQTNRYVEDRMAVAYTRQKVAELRQQELESSLEHAMNISRKMRKSLDEVDQTRQRALQEQEVRFEKVRKELLVYYEKREQASRQEMASAIKEIQDNMVIALKSREEELARQWELKIADYEKERKHQEEQLHRRKATLESEYKGYLQEVQKEKEQWLQHHQVEYDSFMRRAQERERWVMESVAAREKRISELETQMKEDGARRERETETRVLAKEDLLREQYEAIIENMRKSSEQERQKLSDSFVDQLQRITNLHAQNERELERLHREKERELAQQYRSSNLEANFKMDKEKDSFLQDSSLMSKFELLESKQQERAKKMRIFLEEEKGES